MNRENVSDARNQKREVRTCESTANAKHVLNLFIYRERRKQTKKRQVQFLLGNSFNGIEKSTADDYKTETIKIMIVESERIAYQIR